MTAEKCDEKEHFAASEERSDELTYNNINENIT